MRACAFLRMRSIVLPTNSIYVEMLCSAVIPLRDSSPILRLLRRHSEYIVYDTMTSAQFSERACAARPWLYERQRHDVWFYGVMVDSVHKEPDGTVVMI